MNQNINLDSPFDFVSSSARKDFRVYREQKINMIKKFTTMNLIQNSNLDSPSDFVSSNARKTFRVYREQKKSKTNRTDPTPNTQHQEQLGKAFGSRFKNVNPPLLRGIY